MSLASITRPRLLLCDLDGTLVDSVPDLTAAINRMRAALGRGTVGDDEVRHWVGNGAARLVKRALIKRLDGEPPAAEFARAMPLFLDAYAEENCRHAILYATVAESLARFAEAGMPMACITNKPAAFTLPMLDRLGLTERFGVVVSGDTVANMKPHPAPLLHALDFFRVEPHEALMVGDSVNDVEAARAAGVPVVCVTYGYNHGRDIREAGPDATIDTLAELVQQLLDTD